MKILLFFELKMTLQQLFIITKSKLMSMTDKRPVPLFKNNFFWLALVRIGGLLKK